MKKAVAFAGAEADAADDADLGYRYAGASEVTVKPGRARTVAVSYNSPDRADGGEYVWTLLDEGVVSIKGMGNKCVIVGKKEGVAGVVVSGPETPLPYYFRVVCALDEASVRRFRRTRDERTEGRLVGGWSGLELVEGGAE